MVRTFVVVLNGNDVVETTEVDPEKLLLALEWASDLVELEIKTGDEP